MTQYHIFANYTDEWRDTLDDANKLWDDLIADGEGDIRIYRQDLDYDEDGQLEVVSEDYIKGVGGWPI